MRENKGVRLNFSFPLERSQQRFRELIIYISKQSEKDPHFGATKLNKILYHSDFRAFEKFGRPLTGMKYFRLKNGPAPKALLPVRRELEAEGAIRIDEVGAPGFVQHRTVALRRPVLEHFTADEVLLVDQVIDELWIQNATEVSDASHDVRWRTLHDRDDMPYEFAYLSNEPISDMEVQRTEELAAKYGW